MMRQSVRHSMVIPVFLLGCSLTGHSSTLPSAAEPVSEKLNLDSYTSVESNHKASRWQLAPQLGISLPQPLTIGMETYCLNSVRPYCSEQLKYFGAFGYLKWPLTKADRSLSLWSTEVGVRYSPWNSAFYVSGALGYRRITLAVKMSQYTINGVSPAETGSIQLATLFLSPTVGWTWALSQKLSLSAELGAQFPVWGWATFFLENATNGQNSNNTDALQTSSELALRRLANFILPRLTLFRLTYSLD